MTRSIESRGDGFQWMVDTDVYNSNCGLYDHEDWIYKYLDPQVGGGGVVVDVGAFVGTIAIPVAKRTRSHVYAFEPVPAHFQLLQDNINLNGPIDVKATQCAIGNHHGFVPFNDHQVGGFISQIDDKEHSSMVVPIFTLDQQMLAHNLPAIHVVKIDVEGYEVEVLNGMKEIAARYRPRIIVEVHSHFEGRGANGNLIVDWCTLNKYKHRRIWENDPGYFYVELNPDCGCDNK